MTMPVEHMPLAVGGPPGPFWRVLLVFVVAVVFWAAITGNVH